MSKVKVSGGTMSTQKISKGGSRGGAKIRIWELQDEVFFQRFEELTDTQIRFYVGLRREWRQRVVTEEWPR